jgi:hypothetical protein
MNPCTCGSGKRYNKCCGRGKPGHPSDNDPQKPVVVLTNHQDEDTERDIMNSSDMGGYIYMEDPVGVKAIVNPSFTYDESMINGSAEKRLAPDGSPILITHTISGSNNYMFPGVGPINYIVRFNSFWFDNPQKTGKKTFLPMAEVVTNVDINKITQNPSQYRDWIHYMWDHQGAKDAFHAFFKR